MTYASNVVSKCMYGSALMLSVLYAPRAVLAQNLDNHLKPKTVQDALLTIIDIILIFALPLIILYIMYAGYLFVTAQGNPSKVTEARTALLWAVVGGVIVLAAKIIVGVIQSTATAL